MWDLPGPGIEPMPLALAGGFLTIGNSIYQKKLEVYSQDDKAHVLHDNGFAVLTK